MAYSCHRKNALALCKLLLEHGADPEVFSMDGRLPYEMAEDDAVRTLLGGPDQRLFQMAEMGAAEDLQSLIKDGSIKSLKVSLRGQREDLCL